MHYARLDDSGTRILEVVNTKRDRSFLPVIVIYESPTESCPVDESIIIIPSICVIKYYSPVSA